MRSRIFCKKFKSSCILTVVAAIILSLVLTTATSMHQASAISLDDAKTACDNMGGEFTDNTTSTSTNVGECRGDTGETHDEAVEKEEGCENAGGSYQTTHGGSKFICTWSSFDNAEKTFKASEIKTLCESVEGTTFVNASTQGFATCHDLPETTCQVNGGKYIVGICKWENVIDDLPHDTGTEEPTTEATCHSSASSLGWLICPVLEAAASAADWAYKSVIEPSLVTNPELLSTDGDRNGTYQAWGIFRDIANIIFVIFLLVIIYSQITGQGIDNYGIKKSLPKLIVAAILVNVSFYICQGLVDLSNILGSSLYNMLIDIAQNRITIPAASAVMSEGGSIAIGIIGILAVGGIGTLIGGAAFWSAIGSALFALIPVVISAVAGILFLFLLLAMRQAVVVILVALSPIAFVAYTLPNTKNLFDRWAQILRGMLLLYPTAALLIAGGRLAARIIFATAGSENVGIILTAMAAEIAPLFFIPTVVRSAYRATGALGATLNNLRGRVTGGARNLVRNNQRYQNTADRIGRYRTNLRATGRRARNYNASMARMGTSSERWIDRRRTNAGNRERMANINEAQLKAQEEANRIAMMSDPNQVRGMSRGQEISNAEQRGKNEALAAATAAQIEGSRQQAAINTSRQLVNSADYSSATFRSAVIEQADSEHDNSVKRQLMWNSQKYREGKDAESLLARQGDAKRTMLYTNADYITSRGQQQQVAISGEISKMYAERYSRMSVSDVLSELDDAMDATKTGEHRAERYEAASRALIGMGMADKVRDRMTAQSASLHSLMSGTTPDDVRMRNAVASVAGGSGDFVLREYSKHLGMFGGTGKQLSYGDWLKGSAKTGGTTVDGDDEYEKGMSLAASIQDKGLGGLDKDSLKEAAAAGALAGASSREMARYASTVSDPATMKSLVTALSGLSNTERGKIMDATSGAQFVNMNENVRVVLATGGVTATAAGDTAWQTRVGAAIATDPQLRGKLTATEQSRYI